MIVATFEKMLLERELKPVHLIMGKGRQVKWFVCFDKVIGTDTDRKQPEYAMVVFDEEGRCFIDDRHVRDINLDTHYNILACNGDQIIVNGYVIDREPECDLNFNEQP